MRPIRTRTDLLMAVNESRTAEENTEVAQALGEWIDAHPEDASWCRQVGSTLAQKMSWMGGDAPTAHQESAPPPSKDSEGPGPVGEIRGLLAEGKPVGFGYESGDAESLDRGLVVEDLGPSAKTDYRSLGLRLPLEILASERAKKSADARAQERTHPGSQEADGDEREA